MQWLIGINALRFFAIILIVIYHLFRNILPGGFIAVEIFFAISGFLIFSKLIKQFDKDRKIGYWKFVGSRIVRLMPALLVCVVLTLLAAFLVHPDVLAGTRINTLAALTFTTNIKELISGGSYENTISPNLFEHTWFLALEMQFYLIVPLLITFVMGAFKKSQKGAKFLGISLLALSIISYILMGVYGGLFGMQDRAYFALDSHMGAFCLGGVLAVFNFLIPRTPRTKKIIPAIGVAISLIIITILSTKLTFDNPMTFYFGLPFTGLLTVIMIFCIIKLQPNVHVRRRITIPIRIAEKLGGYSYGIYLFHWPLYVLLPNILPHNTESWVAPVLNIAISALLSYLFVKYIRMDRFAKNFKSSAKMRTIYAICLVVVIIPCAISLVRAPQVSSITEQLNSMQEEAKEREDKVLAVDYFGIDSALGDTRDAMLSQLDVAANKDAAPTPQPSRAAPSANSAQVLIIGDSVTLGAKQALESTINGSYVDAVESRGIWTARNILAGYSATGKLPDIIVISLITNEFTITDGLLQSIVDVAGPGHSFVFVTGYAGPQQPRETQNEALKNYVRNHNNTYIADWWELSHDNWSLMYADHIHLNPEGRTAYANLVNNVIRSIKR